MTEWQTPILVAFGGLMSAFVGGLLQALSARSLDRGRFEREAKWSLYTNYFVTLGELSFSKEGEPRHVNALATMAQIRGRIGVISSAEVVEAVSEVFQFQNLTTAEAQIAMAKALEAMRRDVGNSAYRLNGNSLRALMFGSSEDKA